MSASTAPEVSFPGQRQKKDIFSPPLPANPNFFHVFAIRISGRTASRGQPFATPFLLILIPPEVQPLKIPNSTPGLGRASTCFQPAERPIFPPQRPLRNALHGKSQARKGAEVYKKNLPMYTINDFHIITTQSQNKENFNCENQF